MDNFPIGDYLEAFNKEKKSGICKSCKKEVTWSRERIAAHKRGGKCEAVSAEEKLLFAKRKRSSVQDEDAQQEEAKKGEIDDAITKFFCRCGVSFRLADSQPFKNMIAQLNPKYAEDMPSAKTLSSKLLDKQYDESTKKMEESLEECEGITITSDGWTNVRGDHIVNFIIKAPGRPPIFYKAIDTSGIRQGTDAVTEAICAVIVEVGPEKVSAVVTDNAPVMQAAWDGIEARFPHIAAYGCAAHTLNLLIKDILADPCYTNTIKDEVKIAKFVNNHHLVHAKFEEKRKQLGVKHKLSSPVATRWYSHYNSAKDLLNAKVLIKRLAFEDSEDLLTVGPRAATAAIIELMKSDEFWGRLDALVKVIELPTQLIGMNIFL